MESERQVEANRRNALLSCGPRSLQGIERSRANSRKHGLTTPIADNSEGWSGIVAVQQLFLLDGSSLLSSDTLWAVAEHHAELHRIRLAQRAIFSQQLVTAADFYQQFARAIRLDRYAKAAFAKRSSAIRGTKKNGSLQNEPNFLSLGFGFVVVANSCAISPIIYVQLRLLENFFTIEPLVKNLMECAEMQTGTAALKTLMTDALVLWSGAGWDSDSGGFVERLSLQGEPDLAAPRRVRVQVRQIYCFAKVAQLGWYPQGAEIARKGFDYMLAKAKSPDGRPGYVHILAPDGSVLSPLRDTYDHAFILLALATVYQLNRDVRVRAEIDSLMHFIDTELRSPDGGYVEGIPAAMPRRQNPQMHLFEAFIAAFDSTHDPAFQQRAGDIFGLFVSNLFDARTGILGEYFEQDWSRIEPVSVEPGHQAEWVWLLKQFERITGCPTGKYRAVLLESALRYRDATGCLIDEGDVAGNIVKSTRRLWPQTEIIKAWLAQAESGVEGAADEARAALVRLDKHYLQHPVKGGWYDQFDAEGRSLVDTIPASSFYHILCAVAEADRVLGSGAQ